MTKHFSGAPLWASAHAAGHDLDGFGANR